MAVGVSKIFVLPRSRTGLMYIPRSVVTDKGFPFQHGEEIKVSIQGRKLVVERLE